MNLTSALLLLLCCSTLTLRAQNKPAADSIAAHNDSLLTKENLLADIDAYADSIRRNHVQPFSYFPRDSFNHEITRIKANAAQYDIDQLKVQMLLLNARLKDNRTYIHFRYKSIFPYNGYGFSEGIFITRTLPADTAFLWARVIAINQFSIDDAVRRIAQLVPQPGPQAGYAYAPDFIFNPAIIHGLGMAPSEDSITYKVVTYRGDTQLMHPSALPADKIDSLKPRHVGNPLQFRSKLPLWHVYDSARKFVYIQFYGINNMQKDSATKEVTMITQDLDCMRPNTVILDIRYSYGSFSRYAIDRIQDYEYYNHCQLYVLIGKSSLYPAILGALHLKKYSHARVIGEEVAMDLGKLGSVREFKLPHTGVYVTYTDRYYTLMPEQYDGPLKPDVNIPGTFTDYTTGNDAVLDYALQSK